MAQFYSIRRWFIAGCLVFLAAASLCSSAQADPTRVFPEGKLPADRRLAPLKDLNGYFPFEVPDSPEAWKERAEEVRRQMMVATGLWPEPTRTPLNAVVHGRVERDDFTVEKVYFESLPGFFVTGNLYRPKNAEGKLPGVLCPHGHWSNGRFHDHGEAEVRKQIFAGAERFETSGRHPIQARCVQLARMGCVVFHYDMLGYADSKQLSFELAHRFAKQRPDFDSQESWGLFSTQAELRSQNIMGLQTWNSIRALDWLTSLPDVDPERLAVTGASGGGTQTFMVCGIDPRPAVSFPAVMVSTAMQGGCTCENAPLLRIGTGNIELAALFAPKPLGMTAANDWTKEIAAKGLPELKALYAMLGAKNNIDAWPLVHFGHNYNYVSRGLMYHWLNKHLGLGHKEPIVAGDFQPLSVEEMSVWNDEHPAPPGGPEFERSLTRYLAEDSDKQLAALTPKDSTSLYEYRQVVGGALDSIIARDLPESDSIDREKVDKQDQGDWWLFKDVLRLKGHGEELPVIFLHPKEWSGHAVIWIDGQGKAALFDANGEPIAPVAKLLKAGASVASADLLMQGEFLQDGQSAEPTRTVANTREAAAYTHGYNHSLFVRRVHDILTLVSFIANHEDEPRRVHLIGVNGAGPLVAAARHKTGFKADRAVVDTEGFRFAALESYRDENFVPGIVKYGDVPGLLSLSAPHDLLILGEKGAAPKIVQAAYDAGGASKKVASIEDKELDAAVEWLLAE